MRMPQTWPSLMMIGASNSPARLAPETTRHAEMEMTPTRAFARFIRSLLVVSLTDHVESDAPDLDTAAAAAVAAAAAFATPPCAARSAGATPAGYRHQTLGPGHQRLAIAIALDPDED